MKDKIFFIIFIIVWLVLIILNFIWPKKSFSEQENRELATIPSIFNIQSFIDGTYLKKVDDYINDHFFARDIFLKLNSWWEISIMGKNENNEVYVGKDGYLFEKFKYTEIDMNNTQIKEQEISDFARKINVPVYFLLVPNSIYCNDDKLPRNVKVQNQKEIIEDIYAKTKGTINIHVEDNLKDISKNYQLYFKTDHHINSDGAYVIYTKFCESAGIKAEPIENFTRKIISENFLGTFDSKAQIINQEKDKIWIYENDKNKQVKEVVYDKQKTNRIYNEEYLKTKDQYSYFLNGNNSKVKITTNENNQKRLLVLKDSYAHILAQFLCQNYEEIHLIDLRYFKDDISKYVEDNKITDILILHNVTTFVKDKNL